VTNCADDLHALFSRWRQRVIDSPGANMGALLDLDGQGSAAVSAAFAFLHVIEDNLILLGDRGYKVAVHQRNLKKWMRVPLMVTTGWDRGVNHPDHVVRDSTLDEIEALSSFLDGKVLSIDDDRLPSLRALIDQADALLTDSTIDFALLSYIRRLLAAIRHALDDDSAGRQFDFTAAVENLRVAFQAAAESASTPQEKDGWRSMVSNITVGVGTTLAIEIGKHVLGLTS
jgi:hypothetical protein